MTEHTRCMFEVKSAGDSLTPWIALEPYQSLSILRRGFLGLEFRDGVTPEEIQQIADLLNEKVSCVSYTGDEPIRWDNDSE